MFLFFPKNWVWSLFLCTLFHKGKHEIICQLWPFCFFSTTTTTTTMTTTMTTTTTTSLFFPLPPFCFVGILGIGSQPERSISSISGRTGDARSDDFSGSQRNVRSFKAFLSRGLFVRSLGFLRFFCFGVGCWVMSRNGENKREGRRVWRVWLVRCFFFFGGDAIFGVASKKKDGCLPKKVRRCFRCDFFCGRFWRMIPGRCCQAGWHLK